MKRQVPHNKTKDVVEFATKHPQERLNSIKAGLGVLQYGQSEYVRVSSWHYAEQRLQADTLSSNLA